MNNVAFVFSKSPHGTSYGREGLDAILGISVLIKKISIFFIGDGVLQLLKSYQVEKILARNYIPTFSILSLYNIHSLYCCQNSLIERGLSCNFNFFLKIKVLDTQPLHFKLNSFDAIINF